MVSKTNKIMIMGLAALALSCASGESKTVAVDEEVNADSGDPEADQAKKDEEKLTTEALVSASLATITTSLTNNSQTSKAINYELVRDIATKLTEAAKGSRDQGKIRNLQGLLAAQRLTSVESSATFAVAKAIMSERLKKDDKAQMSEEDQLNIALSAIKRRQYAAAELFLDELLKAKDKSVAAGANTAMGVIASIAGNIPEAVVYWKEALKLKPNYEAAHLNLGYTSLKYGRFDLAKKSLEEYQNDWFALAGLSVATFMLGDMKKGEDLCEKSLAKNGNEKTTLYNCGVQSFMAGNDKAAEKYFAKAMKVQGSTRDAYIDEEIYKFQGKMERMVAERREEEELRKIQEAEDKERRKLDKKSGKSEPKGQTVKDSKASGGEPSVDNLLESD